MNAQHKLCKLGNRYRRIVRRLNQLEADKVSEIRIAEKFNREPHLGSIYEHMERLSNRLPVIQSLLINAPKP